jgi:primary-amine oxidase
MAPDSLHPFDPVTAEEIRSAVALLRAEFKGVELRFNFIDVNEPAKDDVIPYVEAERLHPQLLPTPPLRLIQCLFHSKMYPQKGQGRHDV